jgi:hypothetical protein
LADISPVQRSIEARRRVKKIAHLYNTGPGTSAADLARTIGLAPLTVRVHLAALGVKLKTTAGKVLSVSEKQVRSIKADLVRGTPAMQALSDRYGVAKHVIVDIALGRTWGHVPWPRGKSYTRRRHGSPRKLTVAKVLKIKADILKGRLFREIAEEYGVRMINVYVIAQEKTWAHVPWPGGKKYVPRGRPYEVKLTPKNAAEIKAHLLGDELSHLEIAERYGVSEGAVRSIARDRTWKQVPWPNGRKYQGRERGRPPAGRRKAGMVLDTAGRRREELRKAERWYEERRG